METTRPLFLDPYAANRHTGSFILIDSVSHATVAAGMVREILRARQDENTVAAIAIRDPELLRMVENALREDGREVVCTRTANQRLLQQLLHIGLVVLIEAEAPTEVSIAHDSAALAFEPVLGLPQDPGEAAVLVLQALKGSPR